MSYRVPPVVLILPRRLLAAIGGLSGLGIAVSPWLVWWEQVTGQGLALGGQPAPIFTHPVIGTTLPGTPLLLCLGGLCVALWLQEIRTPRRRRTPAAQTSPVLGAVITGALSGLMGLAMLTRWGLPGLTVADQVGPGLYLLVTASGLQAATLLWLATRRAAWPDSHQATP
ncbi:MAG TPA: hypothetical protein VGE07_10180 [Herpetosiphonaceae bacterium]